MTAKKKVKKKSKVVHNQKPIQAPVDVNQQPFYNTAEYIDPEKRYYIQGLSGLDMNILRNALLHYYRANQDQALWNNMEKFTLIKGKIDEAKFIKDGEELTVVEEDDSE